MSKLALSLLVGACASFGALANTLTVTSLNDEFPAATPGTFRYELANSSAGDTIVFDDSIKGGTINMVGVDAVSQDTSFVIAHALTIEGNGVTINGGWNGTPGSATGTRIFLTVADQGKTTIKNLNLVNGHATVWYSTDEKYFLGGAICANSPIRLEGCRLENNCSMDKSDFYSYPDIRGGGAIFAEADVEIDSCYFEANSVHVSGARGGAICQTAGSLTVENTVFDHNSSKIYGGGAVYLNGPVTKAVFTNCKLIENSSSNVDKPGGAILSLMTGGEMKFFGCAFRGGNVPSGGRGGAICMYDAYGPVSATAVTAVDCEFSDCCAGWGGVIFLNVSSPLLLVNCTFHGNSSATFSAALQMTSAYSYFVNCTVAGSYTRKDASECGPLYVSNVSLLNTVFAYNYKGASSATLSDKYNSGFARTCSIFDGYSSLSGTPVPYTLATSMDDLKDAIKLFADYEMVSEGHGYSTDTREAQPTALMPKLSDNDDYATRVVEIDPEGELVSSGYKVRVNADYSYVEYSSNGGASWTKFFSRDGASTENLTEITADQRGIPYKDGLTPVGAATVTPSCKHEHTTTVGLVEPKCEEAGWTGKVTCNDCGETLTEGEPIPATGHQHTTTEGRIEPTCEATGWTGSVTCNDCHKTLTEGEEIPALGHDWDEGVYTTPPTCTKPGEATYTCKRTGCGATKTGTVPALGHLMGEWRIIKEPTPTEKGIRHRECQREGCDYEENEEIDAHTIFVTTLEDNFPADTPIEGSLRAALAEAADGDVIMFDDSLAGGIINLPNFNQTKGGQPSFTVTKAVSIVAPEGGITIKGTHIPGETNKESPRLFSVEKGVTGLVKFKGITFLNGYARGWGAQGDRSYPGGACYVGSPTRFEDCVFEGCELEANYKFDNTNRGGGALCVHADLELKGCTFRACGIISNGGGYGGAIFAFGADAASAPNLTVEDCEFVGNKSKSYGGAVYFGNYIGDVVFRGCLFDGNSAQSFGGAIYDGKLSDSGHSVICDGCSFRNNFASTSGENWGGAVCAKYGKWVFNRCEFSGNSSQFCGGALGMRNGSNIEVCCINCTFVGNMTEKHGGACDFRNGNFYLANCTFAGNRIWNTSDKTDSMSIYSSGTTKMVNCVSVYCPNFAGWVGGSDATQRSTGNYSGYVGVSSCVNFIHGNYTPITDLDDEDNVAAASKLFATDYAYWEYPSHRFPGDTSPVSPANAKVVYPKLANDAKNPNAPRVLPILKDGILNNVGYQVKVNADFTHVCYSSDGGNSWTDLYKDDGADDSTLALITADQRGLRYKDGMIPIGAAGVPDRGGLMFIFR